VRLASGQPGPAATDAGAPATHPFTLVEAMVALLLAGVVMAGAVALMSTSVWGENMGRRAMTASNLAKARLESLRALPYVDLPRMAETRARVNAAGVPDENGVYYRTTAINAENAGSREVVVTVASTWKYNRPELTVTVTSIIVNLELFE